MLVLSGRIPLSVRGLAMQPTQAISVIRPIKRQLTQEPLSHYIIQFTVLCHLEAPQMLPWGLLHFRNCQRRHPAQHRPVIRWLFMLSLLFCSDVTTAL